MLKTATHRAVTALAGWAALLACGDVACAQARGWLDWRGPHQNGVSAEKGLPATWEVGGANHVWEVDLAGRGTPVIADGRLYVMGYRGEGADLQEVLVCLDAATGARRWERAYNDFLSDIIYNRYSIGSPTVDPQTGNVYAMTSPGLLLCVTADGDPVWQHSLMEEWGRLTFPNGRTGSPVIDDDLVIVHGITSNWGAEGPGMDRFYAFDKRTGELVWSSTPGVRPQDSSFSTPVLAWHEGRRVLYCGTGCGHLVALDARTGAPLWRYRISKGGVNASVVLDGDQLIGIHGTENLDSSESGRMVAVGLNGGPPAGRAGPLERDRTAERWRNDLDMFSSSPVLVDERVYQVTQRGMLACVNARTGVVLWRRRLGPDQLHASPLWADGKLYVPMQSGAFYILRPSDQGVEELCRVRLEGNCLGAPSVWNGRIYVHTTRKLYCLGRRGGGPAPPAPPAPPQAPPAGEPVALQIVPAEVLVRPGDTVSFRVRAVDAHGRVVRTCDPARVGWEPFIPPTARVRSQMDAAFNARGELVVPVGARISAGAFRATVDGLSGTFRGRVLADPPLREDFEGVPLSEIHPQEEGVRFAYPPLPWIGARFKWEIRELDGSRVLAKTLDNILFQRATIFLGHPDLRNYTVEADVRSDGNRRNMSVVGVVNQRYIVSLIGNAQQIEVSSNYERLQVGVPFRWRPQVWYRLKTRVDVAPDGSGVVRARAWERGTPEPETWTIEAPVSHAHAQGSPGIFGFSPQSQFRVYVDNVVVTPNG